MNSLNVFILLELFTIRNFKKVDNLTLTSFRQLVINYISNSSSYDEFLSLLSSRCLGCDKKVFLLFSSFKKYIKYANKIWEGNQTKFGYAERCVFNIS